MQNLETRYRYFSPGVILINGLPITMRAQDNDEKRDSTTTAQI